MRKKAIDTFVISVGLNVGSHEPPTQLGRTLAALDVIPPSEFIVHNVRVGESQWDGVPERFVQARYRLSGPRAVGRSRITARLALLARALGQEAIAVLFGTDRWTLVYSDGSASPGGSTAEFPVLV